MMRSREPAHNRAGTVIDSTDPIYSVESESVRASEPTFLDLHAKAFVAKHVKRREKEYLTKETISVFIGTWNLNAKKPVDNLTPFINMGTGEPQADIYVLGFQEIVDLNAQNFIIDHDRAHLWEDYLERFLPRSFVLVSTRHLVGMSLCVYVSRSLFKFISNINTSICGTGIMGVGGNKGAVAVRLKVHDTSLVFICSHLAANKNKVQERNQDYKTITERLTFDPNDTEMKKNEEEEGLFHIDDHDVIFWLGDLNYRLDIDNEELDMVYDKIQENDIAFLLPHDQLIQERRAGRVFQGYEEGAISFLPTYKFQPGTDKYERREDKKKRMPAWCDRIQVKVAKGINVMQLFYRSAEALLASDHKPVASGYKVTCLREIPEKKAQIQFETMVLLNKWENDQLPKVEISPNIIDFGLCKYNQMVRRSITAENKGMSIVEISFIAKPPRGAPPQPVPPDFDEQQNSICPPWLSIHPSSAMLAPGESIEIELSLHITSTALALTLEQMVLEDVLILRLKNGRDFFLAISGSYEKSCLGTSVPFLVNTPLPVRRTDLIPPETALELPKEIWRMVDFIFRRGMREAGLFVTTGDSDEIETIYECLDTGAKFPDVSVHSMAEGLLLLLQSLQEPIFSSELIAQTGDAPLATCAEMALSRMRVSHYNVFVYLTVFFKEVLKLSDFNKSSLPSIVVMFTTCVMQCSPAADQNRQLQTKMWKVSRHFLCADEF